MYILVYGMCIEWVHSELESCTCPCPLFSVILTFCNLNEMEPFLHLITACIFKLLYVPLGPLTGTGGRHLMLQVLAGNKARERKKRKKPPVKMFCYDSHERSAGLALWPSSPFKLAAQLFTTQVAFVE